MAKKSRQELLSEYVDHVEKCSRWRDQQGYEYTWRRLIDLYRGKHWPSTTSNEQDLIAVNLAFSTVNVIAPSVAVNYPKIVVQATKEENVDRAVFVEAIINYMWKHHNFRDPFRHAVKDFLIFGHGWLKVGWKFLEQPQLVSEIERESLIDQAFTEVADFAATSPELAADLPTAEDIYANIPQTIMRVVEDQPFVERISPFDVYVDPQATTLEEASWIAQRLVRPLEEAKNDNRYKPSARKRLSNNYVPDVDKEEINDKAQYLPEQVVIWEYYDMKANTLSVYADGADEFLIDPVAMPYAYGQPFVMVRNYDVPDQFYPIGDLESIESLQLELDKTRSQLMNDRKRYARKWLYHERSFGPEGREALESEDDGRMVPVVDENKPLSEVVVPMPQIPMSADMYNYSAIIEDDINTVSGISEYARGAMPEIRRTATEDMFVNYTRDDITGEYDFSVQAGSTQPMNDTIRKQQAISLMNAVAPLVGTVIDPAALAMHVLENGFGIKDPAKFIMQAQPAPQEAEEAVGEEQMVPPPPDLGGVPMPEGQAGAFAPTGGVPPELLLQLQNQMGLELPSL